MSTGAQIRIIDLPGAIEQLNSLHLPFEQKEVTFEDKQRADGTLLKEMVQNRWLAEAFMNSRMLVTTWNLTEVILRAYVEPQKWQGSDQYRSALGIPLLAENFYASHAAFQQILFSGSRPFMIEPNPGTDLDVAQAQEAIIKAQLKTAGPKMTSAKLEIRAGTFDMLLYGTMVVMCGWETRTTKRVKKVRIGSQSSIPIDDKGSLVTVHGNDDQIQEKTEILEINHPIIEHVPLRRVRCAPDCRRGQIGTASWRGRIIYLDSYQLDSYRDVLGYNIPSRAQLIALTTPQSLDGTRGNVMDHNFGATNANPVGRIDGSPLQAVPESLGTSNVDPLAHKFEIFEYITDARIGWCLEGQYCIRNEANTGDVKMLSCNFRDAPNSFFGYGMGMWITDFQRISQGIVNSFFDDVTLKLMGTYTEEGGYNTQSQNAFVFPGKVFSGKKAMTPLKRDPIGNDVLGLVETVKSWGSSSVGSGPRTMGINPGAPGDMRTKQGVEALGAGEMSQKQELVDNFCELVLIPFIEFCIEQNSKLKPSQLRQMLTKELGDKFKGDPLDLLNASYKVTISAGSKLQAEQTLGKSLGYIQSILQQPSFGDQIALQGKKINYTAFLEGIFQNSGMPYEFNIIEEMTDEDKQRLAAQQQQPNAKLAGDLAKIQAGGETKKNVDDNQAENRALLRTQEAMYEHMDKLNEPQS